MGLELVLDESEMVALFRQDPEKRKDGGFQSLLVALQDACDRPTGVVVLTMEQRRRIRMYAFKYGIGGWEDRLTKAFGRHLGPKLDLDLPPPEW